MRLVHPAYSRRGVPFRPFCAVSLPLVLASLFCLGCTRNFFRERADREVGSILTQKNQYPAWQIEQYHVYPDGRARFADPTNPNRPPMPPDDPAAKTLSPNPQKPKHAGIAYIEGDEYLAILAGWNQQNRAEAGDGDGLKLQALDLKVGQSVVPSEPDWRPALEEQNANAFRLRLDQATELGLFNSREYQSRREDLYLTSLPVTLQRFNFTSQWFATEEAVREWTGFETPEGKHNRWTLDSNAGFTRQFVTGALLLVQFANQAVFEFANTGGKPTISESLLRLEFFQPLLQDGGRAVTMEPLTQAERDLLYEIRRFARFRKEFYVAIAGGGNLSGGAGTIPGFENLDLTQGVFQSSTGYLPIILRAGQLAIEAQNIIHIEEILRFFQAFSQGEGSDITPLQVDQIEQRLLNSRNNLLDRLVDYGNSLDRFKLQLGVPTNVPLELEDTPLRDLADQLRQFVVTFNGFKAARKAATAFTNMEEAAQLRGRLRQIIADSELTRGTRFAEDLPARWSRWEGLRAAPLGYLAGGLTSTPAAPLAGLALLHFAQLDPLRDRLEQLRREQGRLLDLQTDLEIKGAALSAADEQWLAEVTSELDLGRFERALRLFESQPWLLVKDMDRRQERFATLFRDVINQFELVLGAARTERILQIRQNWPELPPIRLAGVDLLAGESEAAYNLAGQVALDNRFDLMNTRAELVDSWRQITVSANALLGVFNVRYQGDLLSPLGEATPLDIGGRAYRHRLILSGELPLVRLPQRNQYRAALIAFQRARRRVMSVEDRIQADIRTELRQLRRLAENYKIAQRSVELAYFQVENSLDTFQAPPLPGQTTTGAASAAALTQQLLNALNSLPQAQSQLYSAWVQFQITRLQLFRDLELMPLDSQGVWIDELTTDPANRPGEPFRFQLPEPRELGLAPPEGQPQ